MKRRHLILPRVVMALYWAGLLVLTHMPNPGLDKDYEIYNESLPLGLDKWGHIGCFGLLAVLAMTSRLFGKRRLAQLGTVAMLLVYCVVDEYTQPIFGRGREFHWDDILASMAGVIVGSLIWLAWQYLSRPSHSFANNTRVLSIITFASRIFGLVREWALAFAFGFTPVLDAYTIAFMVPNLFRRLFGEGSLAIAFLPSYAQLDRDSPATARLFGRRILRWLVMLLVGVAAASAVILAGLLLWGNLDDRGALASRLTVIMIWYMPLVCSAAVLGAMLQVHGRFAAPAAAPVLLNVAIIGAAIGGRMVFSSYSPASRTYAVAAAVLAAGVFQVLWLLITLSAAREAQADDKPVDHELLRDARRRLFGRWLPMVVGLAVLQINTLGDSLIAMFFSGKPGESLHLFGHAFDYPMHEGAVAVLGATARLYEFPLGVFAIALATAIYPALSRAANDADTFAALVRQGLRLSVFIALPAGVGLILIRHPLAQAVFAKAGALTENDSQRVAWVLLGYAPAIWAYSLNQLITRVFYARDDSRTPVRVAVAMVVLNIALNLSLMWLPVPGNPMGDCLGAAGLAWSTAICATLQCVILLWLARRHVARPIDRTVFASWLRTAAGTVAMGIAVWLIVQLVPRWLGKTLHELGRFESILLLLVAVVVGAIVLAGAARALGMAELRWALRRQAE